MTNSWPPLANTASTIGKRYRLLHSLGEGTFGEVFYAEDTKFDPPRPVALKLLHRAFSRDAEVLESIRREANILARFSHPHILRVLDYETHPVQAYIVTELAPKGSLAKILQPDPNKPTRPLTIEAATYFLEQISSGLDEAHRHGLVHRDIKPENILLDKNNRALLADFGLALTLANPRSTLHGIGSGGVWGTAEYAAPEIWDEKVGRGADIYALGVLVYQLLTGYPPFRGTAAAVMKQHLQSPVPSLSVTAPWVKNAYALDKFFARAMAKTPHERPRTAAELFQEFRVACQTSVPFAPPAPTMPTAPVSPPFPWESFKNSEVMQERYRLLKTMFNVLHLAQQYLFKRTLTPDNLFRRGQIYARLDLHQLALHHYNRTIELDAEFAPAYRGKAKTLAAQGKIPEARRELETALLLGDKTAGEELKRLEKAN